MFYGIHTLWRQYRIMNYIVIVSNMPFFKKVFGPFLSVEEVKDWIKNKYHDSECHIDIHPVIPPTDYKE